MKGDFSRVTFEPEKHYSGVLVQQGRVLTDDDFNSAQSIGRYRDQMTTADVIGQAGAPKATPGFRLGLDQQGELMIGVGHFYVDGILCENEQTVPYGTQPHLPHAPTVLSLLQGANTSFGLVYLDVHQRHQTFLDDPAIREPALNSDTTTRSQTVWQVRVLPLAIGNVSSATLTALVQAATQVDVLVQQLAAATTDVDRNRLARALRDAERVAAALGQQAGLACDRSYQEWTALTAASTGQLAVQTAPVPVVESPCDVPPGGGFLRTENQLYRVEVQQVGSTGRRAGSAFKWSRENGSVVAQILLVGTLSTGDQTGTVIQVHSTGPDDVLGFNVDDWVEYTDDERELLGLPGALVQIGGVDRATNTITLRAAITARFGLHPKLRRWDQTGQSATAQGVAMNQNNTWVDLEANIQVRFDDGTYRVGDYWQFHARAETGLIYFPATPQAPAGVEHHYARLGFVVLDSNQVRPVLDCRDLFPPLTDITAWDVSFDNSRCQLTGAETVQEALEQLCGRSGGTCIGVGPAPDWFRVFERIPERGDAEICFTVGDFVLEQPVRIPRKGNLKLVGAGPGTRILAMKSEAALIFEECTSVLVRDLYAEAGRVGADTAENSSLNGALTFEDCVAVTVERSTLRCAAGLDRAAACLTVRNTAKRADLLRTTGLVEVRHCQLLVGHGQIGALIVNGARTSVTDNVIECVDGRSDSLKLGRLRRSAALRRAIRHVLVDDVRLAPDRNLRPAADEGEFRLDLDGQVLTFRTDPGLVKLDFWSRALRPRRDELRRSAEAAERVIADIANALLFDPDRFDRRDELEDWLKVFTHDDTGALYQGITVAGEEASEVRLRDNTIINAMQGLHLGLSRRDAPSEERLQSQAVSIEGNTVYTVVSPLINRAAHGIFSGNSESLLIEGNVLARRGQRTTNHLVAHGIHAAGAFGRRVIMRHNDAEDYTTGILVEPDRSQTPHRWVVAENAATVRSTSGDVLLLNNLP